MDELSTERPKYVNLHESPPQGDPEGQWKNFGTSIFLGFVATAVLIFIFLILAIFEHLFRPNVSLQTSHGPNDPGSVEKLVDPQPPVQVGYASDFSVLMPGHHYPTYIAHPTPLPCSREGVHWPSHYEGNFVHP